MLLLFLALPFVKLATLTARERFAFVDALALVTATIVLASVSAAIPFVISQVDQEDDSSLRWLSALLEKQFVRDVENVLDFGVHLPLPTAPTAPTLSPCALREPRDTAPKTQAPPSSSAGDRGCDLWKALNTPGRKATKALDADLDVVLWLDGEGQQTVKWTTKAQVTDLISHERLKHFRDLQVRRLWTFGRARRSAAVHHRTAARTDHGRTGRHRRIPLEKTKGRNTTACRSNTPPTCTRTTASTTRRQGRARHARERAGAVRPVVPGAEPAAAVDDRRGRAA